MGSQPKGISASRAASILGLGEYEGQTPFTTWQNIMEERFPPQPVSGIVPPTKAGIPRGEPGYIGFNAERGYLLPEPPDNAAIRFGTAFEDAIVELASAKAGEQIGCREELHWINFNGESKTGPRSLAEIGTSEPYGDPITCHVDGIYAPSLRLHEGKTTNLFSFRELWGEPGSDRVPSGYQVQAQHQMLCTGAGECIVSVLVFPRRPDEWEKEGYQMVRDETGVWHLNTDAMINAASIPGWARVIAEMGLFYQYPVAAKAELQAEMVERYRAFWSDYVIAEREPPIDCYSDFKRAFPTPKGTIIADEQVERWAAEWREIGEEIGAKGRLGKRREELKLLMLSYMRAADRAMDDESREATVLRDQTGKKLASFNGKTFR